MNTKNEFDKYNSVDFKYGHLELPRGYHCMGCILTNQYWECTKCDFRDKLCIEIQPLYAEAYHKINKIINDEGDEEL